jgi:hypothetical protein
MFYNMACRLHSSIAQLVEHSAVNRVVVGSSPTRGANLYILQTGFLRKTCFPISWAYSSAVEQPAHNRLVPGSIPGGPTILYGPFDKRLSHRPFTAASGVRIPHGSPSRAISSAGRAPALQAGCRRFDPVIAHQYK